MTNQKNLIKNDFSKKSLLKIGLLFNIGLLIFFKYMDFFISNTNFVLKTEIPLWYLTLPLGISFFTLQQITLLVDTYEGLVNETKILNYMLYVVFFPQLVAGPIVHHKDMMPQFEGRKNKVKNFDNIALGLFIFFIGLFKKVIMGDVLGTWASAGFDTSTSLDFFEAWTTSLAYTFQLYFDFSGYTDMAIGAGLLFNIKLPQNFNSPLMATGTIDFWKRWHITLTSFITTYIYTPIVRSFKTLTFNKGMMATVAAFFIAGLWHGASWMFILYGILHGVGLVINHYWRRTKIKISPILAWFITFNFINITFVVFRAKVWTDASKIFNGMLGLRGVVLPKILATPLAFLGNYGVEFDNFLKNINGDLSTAVWLLAAFFIIIKFKNSNEYLNCFRPTYRNLFFLVSASIISLLYLNSSRVVEFLYYDF